MTEVGKNSVCGGGSATNPASSTLPHTVIAGYGGETPRHCPSPRRLRPLDCRRLWTGLQHQWTHRLASVGGWLSSVQATTVSRAGHCQLACQSDEWPVRPDVLRCMHSTPNDVNRIPWSSHLTHTPAPHRPLHPGQAVRSRCVLINGQQWFTRQYLVSNISQSHELQADLHTFWRNTKKKTTRNSFLSLYSIISFNNIHHYHNRRSNLLSIITLICPLKRNPST